MNWLDYRRWLTVVMAILAMLVLTSCAEPGVESEWRWRQTNREWRPLPGDTFQGVTP